MEFGGSEPFKEVLKNIKEQVDLEGFDPKTSPLLEGHHGSGEGVISLFEMLWHYISETGHHIANEK